MKKYEAPMLFVDEFVADTMIASTTAGPKNGAADVNQNCAGCKDYKGQVVGENVCVYLTGTDAANLFCP